MPKNSGNTWDPEIIYSCGQCGEGELCDVCHQHDQPRGDCDECPPAPKEEE